MTQPRAEREHGRTGVLLVNLGTPESTEVGDVRRYLAEFLSDPRVVDIPTAARRTLLHGIILRTRPAKSAESYRRIWTDRGSPLLVHGQELASRVQDRFGPEVPVRLAMRYGKPSIRSAVEELAAIPVERLVVLPLFPQYSSAAHGSATEAVMRVASEQWNVPAVHVVPPYYDHPAFVRAQKAVVQPTLEEGRPEHVVISFHGVPERHVRKSDPTGQHCLERADCCDAIGRVNRFCYRAQCYATARALAAELGLEDHRYTVAFQSRLGRTPWIRPYTDEVIEELGGRGLGSIAVLEPSFVADCLETTEEIGIRGRELFSGAGGGELYLAPCLNAAEPWVDAVEELLRDSCGWLPQQDEADGVRAAG